jgi:hypothetical protein
MKNNSPSNRPRRLHDVPPSITRWRRQPQRKPSKQSALESVWQQNWTLLVGLFSVGFISARLLAAATGDPETAYAILQATGTGSVVVGGLIPAIGLLVFPLAVVGFYHGFSKKRIANSSQTVLMLAVSVLALIIAVFTAPAYVLLLSIGLTLFLIIVAAIARLSTEEKRRRSLSDHWPSPYALITTYSIIAIVFTAISSTPWLPSENIIIKGRQSFSAYILAQNLQITSILTQGPTAVVQLPSSKIVAMQICKTPYYRSQEETINQWLGNFLRADRIFPYPRCDPSFYKVK